jgi:hypothetical protein
MSIIRDCARVGVLSSAKTLSSMLAGLFLLFAGSSAMATPAPATLLTPSNNETFDRLNSPQFSWAQGLPQASWFHIYISKNNSQYLDFWVPANTFSATNFWTSTNILGHGTYTWWVQTFNSDGIGPWSPGRTFYVVGIPHAITGISPRGTTESTPSVTYAWYAPDGYTTWYELLILKNGATYSDTWHTVAPGDLQTSVNGQFTQLSWTLKNQPSGVYSWWVRGWSADGMGPWSGGMTFTNRLTSPGTVTILSPANGTVVSNSLPECSWQNNGGATWYCLYLYRNSTVYSSQWLEGLTTWTPTNNLPVGNYTWWIAPWNPDGYGAWSSGTFSVPVRMPSGMALMGPSGTMCEYSPMTYTWSADPNTAWYQLIILKGSTTLVNRWYPANASQNWDPALFEIDLPEQHGAGNFSWWVRGWSSDGYGPWCSTNFMIYGANEIMPLAGSSWVGNFTTESDGLYKTHIINNLTLNADGTFSGSGNYQIWNQFSTNETYVGTYVIDSGVIAANGIEYWNGQPQGNISFSFSFDATGQHLTSGAWTDSWDNGQSFDITPNEQTGYYQYITRNCGQ